MYESKKKIIRTVAVELILSYFQKYLIFLHNRPTFQYTLPIC